MGESSMSTVNPNHFQKRPKHPKLTPAAEIPASLVRGWFIFYVTQFCEMRGLNYFRYILNHGSYTTACDESVQAVYALSVSIRY